MYMSPATAVCIEVPAHSSSSLLSTYDDNNHRQPSVSPVVVGIPVS